MYNRPIIHKTALCPCREHEFPLEECTERYMRCTGGAMIPQEQLVPDLLLANVDQQYIVDESDLIIEENPQSMLGEGGFGSVYRAKYKNKNVAVKVGSTSRPRKVPSSYPFDSALPQWHFIFVLLSRIVDFSTAD